MQAPPDQYTVRGEIVSVPDPARPTSEFVVHHEAIPTFKDAKGEVVKNEKGKAVGMGSMEMPFPLSKGASLAGFKPGDRVSMTLLVWRKPLHFEVTKIEKLPENEPLDFGAGAK